MNNVPGHLVGAFESPAKYVREVFADSEFQVVDPTLPAVRTLPTESRDFLAGVGLPLDHDFLNQNWGLSFGLTKNGPAVLDTFSDRLKERPSERLLGYVCFNEYNGEYTCADSSHSGSIVMVDTNMLYGETYVNCDVCRFCVFLAMYVAHFAATADLEWEDSSQLDDALKDCMRRLDSSAFSSPRNWWSVVLEELREGMFG